VHCGTDCCGFGGFEKCLELHVRNELLFGCVQKQGSALITLRVAPGKAAAQIQRCLRSAEGVNSFQKLKTKKQQMKQFEHKKR
jgi:hypothetical protein